MNNIEQMAEKKKTKEKHQQQVAHQIRSSVAARLPLPQDLYRASFGSEGHSSADSLDHYAACLILKEAQAKHQKYSKNGAQVYFTTTIADEGFVGGFLFSRRVQTMILTIKQWELISPSMRADTGFLTRVLKQTASHNVAHSKRVRNGYDNDDVPVSTTTIHPKKKQRHRSPSYDHERSIIPSNRAKKKIENEVRGRGNASGAARLDAVFDKTYDAKSDLSQFDILTNDALDDVLVVNDDNSNKKKKKKKNKDRT